MTADPKRQVASGLRRRCGTWLDDWLPRTCVFCEQRLGRHEPHCCGLCAGRIAGAGAPRCPVCAARTPGGVTCAGCRADPPAFDATVVLGDYAPPLDRLIGALKFQGRIHLATALAGLLLERHGAGLRPAGLVVPVPLASARLAERGYNQALEIARGVGRGLEAPVAVHALRRARATRPQPGLARPERRRNLAGALDWHGPRLATAGRVLLVDDVMTTGATLDEAAAVLRAAGAMQVVAVVAARTPAPVAAGEAAGTVGPAAEAR